MLISNLSEVHVHLILHDSYDFKKRLSYCHELSELNWKPDCPLIFYERQHLILGYFFQLKSPTVYLGRWDKFCFEETLLISFLYLSHWHRNSEVWVIFSSRIGTKNILKSYDTWSESNLCMGSEGANWQREQTDRKADFLDSEGAVSEYGSVSVQLQNHQLNSIQGFH